ncbi:MAG: CdaR family protein [Bacteroidota bacterium]|nr:CdaR family protein [Bacteroidota bacterium]
MGKNTGLVKNKGTRLKQRMVVFLICIVVSVFFWLLMSLSKEYKMTLRFPVTYINLPADKIVSNTLPKEITIEVKARGFYLLKYKFRSQRETIGIDVKDVNPIRKNQFFLLTNSRTDNITSQFNNDIKIVNISPDSILLNYNKKVSKLVRAKYDLSISFADEYQLSDSIKLDPAFITVSGSSEVIAMINEVQTQPVVLKDIDKSMTIQLRVLKDPKQEQVEFSHENIKATLSVTKFTEGSIDLPLEVMNLPNGYSLKTFPDKVNVKYSVAFENYEKITASQFRAVVDFNKIEQGSNKLKVQLLLAPSEVRTAKLSPEKVEYIIRK